MLCLVTLNAISEIKSVENSLKVKSQMMLGGHRFLHKFSPAVK